MLHVGADQSCKETLGVNGPIFEDRTFEFIPITECLRKGEEEGQAIEIRTTERTAYSDLPARNMLHGNVLSDYLPRDAESSIVHNDPDFKNCTYGDRTDDSRGKQISNLNSGDYLFFIASLAPFAKEAYDGKNRNTIKRSQKGRMAKFLIGYFKVKGVYLSLKWGNEAEPDLYDLETEDQETINSKISKDALNRIMCSVHTKRNDDEYYIVLGEPSDSALLSKAIRITQNGPPFPPSEIGAKVYGNISFPRGFKWINDKQVEIMLEFIKNSK
jgi:hypothetical protein